MRGSGFRVNVKAPILAHLSALGSPSKDAQASLYSGVFVVYFGVSGLGSRLGLLVFGLRVPGFRASGSKPKP